MFALNNDSNTVSDVNSQEMVLLSSNFALEIPTAIGGPDAPYVQDGALHPHTYIASPALSDLRQDEDGISYYIVQDGDTVSEIAELFDVSTNTILWENNIGRKIKVGDELRILPVIGLRHKISKGDTIAKIAKKYQVEKEDITIYNNIDQSNLVVDNLLIIPNGVKKSVSKSVSSFVRNIGTSNSISNGYYLRPTGGRISSRFGPRNNGYHYGIDYALATGSPIVAAASGTVIKTSCGSGYGKCLVIQHDNGTQTLYAHAHALYVTRGQKVKKGQEIAAVGSTGKSSGPHLHFEIIKANGQKLDPDKHL